MSYLINIVKARNVETLSNTCSTIPNCPSHIDMNEESWCLRDVNQESISPKNLELDQYQPIDNLLSFHFNIIEFEHECDPDSQLCNAIQIFESMLIPLSLPKLDPFP